MLQVSVEGRALAHHLDGGSRRTLQALRARERNRFSQSGEVKPDTSIRHVNPTLNPDASIQTG
jgi:hypothetical protein